MTKTLNERFALLQGSGNEKAMWEARIARSKASIAFEEHDIALAEKALAAL